MTVQSIELWSGWSIGLPDADYVRNQDGSWSAWGEDWVVDVSIIDFELGDTEQGILLEETLEKGGLHLEGTGWRGVAETLVEEDGGRDVFRLAGTLVAPGSVMSCWISYLREDQQQFARRLMESVAHVVPSDR